MFFFFAMSSPLGPLHYSKTTLTEPCTSLSLAPSLTCQQDKKKEQKNGSHPLKMYSNLYAVLPYPPFCFN